MTAPRTNASRDQNHTVTLIGVSTLDGTTPVPVEVDPTTGQVQVSSTGGGGGSGTEYTDGGVPPAHPAGGTIEWNDGTNWQTVSTAKPLPVNASVSFATPTAVQYGQATVSVTNTAVQLTNQAITGVVLQALAGNVGNVVIGDASVTTANGFQLQPGQATGVAISNVNKLYVNGTSGDGVCWIGS